MMGVAATPKYKEGAYWIHRGMKEFRGSNWTCFDNYTFYNVTNGFYSAIKTAKGV